MIWTRVAASAPLRTDRGPAEVCEVDDMVGKAQVVVRLLQDGNAT